MQERYLEAIVKHLSEKEYQPLKARQLAHRLGVPEPEYGAFREAVKRLMAEGRVVSGPKNALALPPIGERVVGVYRGNPRGFGFVIPDELNAHGDLFIPEGASGTAITGDRVAAKVYRGGRREGGEQIYRGQITEVLERGQNRFVGQLQHAEDVWFILPQGIVMTDPIVIQDVGPAAKAGVKVVVEIVQYPRAGELGRGVIVEVLGQAGPADVETLAVIREYGLPDAFDEAALEQARALAREFSEAAPVDPSGREDLTGLTIVTIDPDDARDYDDAISLERTASGWRLGVHIADVAHFVTEGSPLDEQARLRGNSVYFPRKVVPMLPEILSNGVCSLQEGVGRFVKSAFIDYDADGEILGARFANGVIRSAKRLTYLQAQGILDGKVGGYEGQIVELVRAMETLARRIEARRRRAGMIHLDLPEVKLVLSDEGKVLDAAQADDSYTHTIIEMFMVEANDAVARLLDGQEVPFLRRIHPESDGESKQLTDFIRACGLKIPRDLSRHDMQSLIDKVRGKPESYAVNLALLKTFERAEYSPLRVGHFALASDHYCHFTSPIRRYPDLTVHRLLDAYLRETLEPETVDPQATAQLGDHCNVTERRAATAENELRKLLVLQMLSDHIGEDLDGVVTGVTNFGVFVQSTRYLVEGLCRLADLGDDWWEVDLRHGLVVGERTGRRIRLGDAVKARIVAIDLAQRKMDLRIEPLAGAPKRPAAEKKARQKPGRAQKSAKGAKSAKSAKTTTETPRDSEAKKPSRRRRRRSR